MGLGIFFGPHTTSISFYLDKYLAPPPPPVVIVHIGVCLCACMTFSLPCERSSCFFIILRFLFHDSQVKQKKQSSCSCLISFIPSLRFPVFFVSLSPSLSLSLSFVSISFLFTKHIWFVVCLNQLFFLKNSYDYSDIVLVTAVTFKKQQKKH